jgi:hypothetical protein
MSDTPFSVILQQAAALKTAQLAVDRTRYDSWDTWYQHSLFGKEVALYCIDCFSSIEVAKTVISLFIG